MRPEDEDLETAEQLYRYLPVLGENVQMNAVESEVHAMKKGGLEATGSLAQTDDREPVAHEPTTIFFS